MIENIGIHDSSVAQMTMTENNDMTENIGIYDSSVAQMTMTENNDMTDMKSVVMHITTKIIFTLICIYIKNHRILARFI